MSPPTGSERRWVGVADFADYLGISERSAWRMVSTDPDVNTRVAWALYVDSGYRWGFHWAASASCWGGGW